MKYFSNGLRIFLGISLAFTVNRVQAQARMTGSHMTLDFAGGITAIHANEGPGQCGCFYMIGGNGEAVITNNRHLSFVTNVGYTSASNINNIQRNLALLTVLEGGRYTLNSEGKLSPFGQVSVGIVHTISNYRIDESSTREAFAAGGGLDLRVSERFSFRPVEAEYLLTAVANGQNNFQNQLRMSAGIVFHLNR